MYTEVTTGSVTIKPDGSHVKDNPPTTVVTLFKNIYPALAEEFPAEQIRQLKKGSELLDYISIAEAVHRMNTVVGVENWRFEILQIINDPRDASAIIIHVLVTATINGKEVRREAIGGHLVPAKGMELGDAYKSAVSDALKKALTFFGVGLHLSRKEESLAYEQRQVNQPDPAAIAAMEELLKRSKTLNDEEKVMLRTMWKAVNGDIKVDPHAGVGALRQAIRDIDTIVTGRSATPDTADTNEPEATEDGVGALQNAFPGSRVIDEA